MSDDTQPAIPPAFVEYDVAGVGTVIDPQGEPGYRVRLPNGQVTAYPAASGNPCQDNAAADIAAAIAAPVVAVPATVTRRQLLLALNAIGVTRAAIRSLLAGNEAGLIEFDEAATFDRMHPLVGQLATALGMAASEIDALYRTAATL